jgi:hypothetical protein
MAPGTPRYEQYNVLIFTTTVTTTATSTAVPILLLSLAIPP